MLCAVVYCTFAFALTVQGAAFCICPDGTIVSETECQQSDCCAEESSVSDCDHDHSELESAACADAHQCIGIAIPESGTDGSALVTAESRGAKAKPFHDIVLAHHDMALVPGLTGAGHTAFSVSPALTASAQSAPAPMPLILRL